MGGGEPASHLTSESDDFNSGRLRKKVNHFFNPLREWTPQPCKFSAPDHYIKKCRRQVNQLDFNRRPYRNDGVELEN